MENPVNYLQFAAGDRFYDREEIRRDQTSRFLSGQTNVVLYGPRRYGKSSLVAELTADLENASIPCVTLDVAKVPSIELFVKAYVQKVYRKLEPGKFELRKIGGFLKRLSPKLTLDTHEFDDAYRRRFRLGPSSTVNSARRKLVEDGHIELFESECQIADPVFAEFL